MQKIDWFLYDLIKLIPHLNTSLFKYFRFTFVAFCCVFCRDWIVMKFNLFNLLIIWWIINLKGINSYFYRLPNITCTFLMSRNDEDNCKTHTPISCSIARAHYVFLLLLLNIWIFKNKKSAKSVTLRKNVFYDQY